MFWCCNRYKCHKRRWAGHSSIHQVSLWRFKFFNVCIKKKKSRELSIENLYQHLNFLCYFIYLWKFNIFSTKREIRFNYYEFVLKCSLLFNRHLLQMPKPILDSELVVNFFRGENNTTKSLNAKSTTPVNAITISKGQFLSV